MIPSPEYYLPPEFMRIVALFALAFGCCVGSYLNVVIYRLPLGLSTHNPRRSFCPSCKYPIPMWLNIPIVSWLMLRGKCANCRASISPRYLFVELLTGLLFMVAFLYLGLGWKVLAAWTFLALSVAASYIDIDHQILPHEITWGGTIAGLAASVAIPNLIVADSRWINLAHAAGGAALGYAIIWCIVHLGKLAFGRLKLAFDKPVDWSVSQAEGAEEPVFRVAGQEEGWSNIFNRATDRLMVRAVSATLNERSMENVSLTMSNDTVVVRHAEEDGGGTETILLENIKAMSGTCTSVEQPREAMGMGDANWMACVGAFFGWKAVLFTILAGSVIGAALSLCMIVLRRREWAARIPFGPYLAAGAVLWLFFGHPLLAWYLGLRGGQSVEVP